MTKIIKAILFDLDGTLRFSRPAGTEIFANRVLEIGLPINDSDRLRAARWEHYYWAQSADLLQDVKTWDEHEDEFWLNYSRRQLVALGLAEEDAATHAPALHTFMKEHYKPEDWVPAATPEVLSRLREQGLALAVVSNRMKAYDDYLVEKGIGQYFEFSLAAGLVGNWKPEPEIFQHALQKLDIQPHEALYVGDNYFADVVGARAAGLQPVLIDPKGIFDEPGCPVIQSIEEIPKLLQRM